MTEKMNILAVIPARAGSRGIPNKNIRIVGGRPLVWYSISNALASEAVTDVVVTTDSPEVRIIATQMGARVRWRDEALCADDVTLDAVVHDASSRAKGVVRLRARILTGYGRGQESPSDPEYTADGLQHVGHGLLVGDAQVLCSATLQVDGPKLLNGYASFGRAVRRQRDVLCSGSAFKLLVIGGPTLPRGHPAIEVRSG